MLASPALERWLYGGAGGMGLLAVALGAFGAHGLTRALASADDAVRRIDWWKTAAQYHLAHALAIGLAAVLCGRGAGAAAGWAGGLFGAGILIFSGSLYSMALTGARGLGAVTPIGGLCLLAGWAAFVVAALRLR